MKRAAPIAFWLFIQIVVLASGWARVPLWARSGTAAQHLPLGEMLAVQFIAAGLLFPSLLNRQNRVVVILTAFPFLQLAAALTDTSHIRVSAAYLHTVLWMCGLSVWNTFLGKTKARMPAISIASFIVIGAPLIAYLSQEFSLNPGSPAEMSNLAWNPLFAAILQGYASQFKPAWAIGSAILIGSGFLANVLKSAFHQLAPSYPQPDAPVAHNPSAE